MKHDDGTTATGLRRQTHGGNRRRTHCVPATAALMLATALALAGCAAGPDTADGSAPGSGTSTEGSSMATNPIDPSRAPSVSPPMVSSSPGPGKTVPPTSESPPSKVDADLAISLSPDGKNVGTTYRLVCSNGVAVKGTDHPQSDDACAFLAGHGAQLLTTKPRTAGMCTQQDNGPQTAVVEGTLNGQKVQRTFSLHDGCQISAWKSAEALLGRGTSAGTL